MHFGKNDYDHYIGTTCGIRVNDIRYEPDKQYQENNGICGNPFVVEFENGEIMPFRKWEEVINRGEELAPPETPSEESPGEKLVNRIIEQNIDKMNRPNQIAAKIMATEGIEASVKHMLIDHETGEPLTYAEMRYRYG